MEWKVIQKGIRMSPRRVKLVADSIRGENVNKATAILAMTQKRAAVYLQKALKSAMANASTNLEVDIDNLYIAEVFGTPGVTLKRWQPKARGGTGGLEHPSVHITLVLKVGPGKQPKAYTPRKKASTEAK